MVVGWVIWCVAAPWRSQSMPAGTQLHVLVSMLSKGGLVLSKMESLHWEKYHQNCCFWWGRSVASKKKWSLEMAWERASGTMTLILQKALPLEMAWKRASDTMTLTPHKKGCSYLGSDLSKRVNVLTCCSRQFVVDLTIYSRVALTAPITIIDFSGIRDTFRREALCSNREIVGFWHGRNCEDLLFVVASTVSKCNQRAQKEQSFQGNRSVNYSASTQDVKCGSNCEYSGSDLCHSSVDSHDRVNYASAKTGPLQQTVPNSLYICECK